MSRKNLQKIFDTISFLDQLNKFNEKMKQMNEQLQQNQQQTVNQGSSYQQTNNVVAQPRVENPNEFTKPNNLSLSQEEEWLKNVKNRYIIRSERLIDNINKSCKDYVVTTEDTKETINQKYQNASSIFNTCRNNIAKLYFEAEFLTESGQKLDIEPIVEISRMNNVNSYYVYTTKVVDSTPVSYPPQDTDADRGMFGAGIRAKILDVEIYIQYLKVAYADIERAKSDRIKVIEEKVASSDRELEYFSFKEREYIKKRWVDIEKQELAERKKEEAIRQKERENYEAQMKKYEQERVKQVQSTQKNLKSKY